MRKLKKENINVAYRVVINDENDRDDYGEIKTKIKAIKEFNACRLDVNVSYCRLEKVKYYGDIKNIKTIRIIEIDIITSYHYEDSGKQSTIRESMGESR